MTDGQDDHEGGNATTFLVNCPDCNRPVARVEWMKGAPPSYECTCGFQADPALEWLQSPSLLGLLENAITGPGSDKPLVGEEDTAIQLLFVLLAKGSVEVRGLSGSGKNSLVDHVLAIFPRDSWEKVGGLTDKAIRYIPEGMKILYITERRGMQSGRKGEESTAEYDVKLGISEGEVSVFTTERNEDTGRFETVIRKVGIESFILTTTEVAAPPELENRINVLYVKDDIAQNMMVRDSQLDNARKFSWEKQDFTVKRATAARALNFVWRQGPTRAIIPFTESLKSILSIETADVRRHTPRILDLIQSCGRLHYLQRKIVTGPTGAREVIAQPEDLALVLYSGQRALASVLSAVPEKARMVWEICRHIEEAKLPITVQSIMQNAGNGEAKMPIGAKRTVQASVKVLADKGILTEQQVKEGKWKVYDLATFDLPTTLDIPEILQAAAEEYGRVQSTVNPAALCVEQTGVAISAVDRGAPSMDAPRSIASNPIPNPSAQSAAEVMDGHT